MRPVGSFVRFRDARQPTVSFPGSMSVKQSLAERYRVMSSAPVARRAVWQSRQAATWSTRYLPRSTFDSARASGRPASGIVTAASGALLLLLLPQAASATHVIQARLFFMLFPP